MTSRSEASFDEGWAFRRGDVAGAEAPAFDDRGWRIVEAPHDWRIEDLPTTDSGDGAATADPSLFVFAGPEIDPTIPRAIGPFDVDADVVPDIDREHEVVGRICFPPGRGQGYTVGEVAWYRKRFDAPAIRDDQRVELRFDGVMGRTDVWLNGEKLGRNAYGYTPFTFDVTTRLRDGENVVALRVDNTGKVSRWYTGAGIFRHTWLTVTNAVHVPTDGIKITTPAVEASSAVVRAEIKVDNRGPAADVAITAIVLDPHGTSVATGHAESFEVVPSKVGLTAIELSVPDPARWSPDHPHLYALVIELRSPSGTLLDSVTTRFGIRTIEFSGTDGFLLNGERVVVRGGNVHHDHGPLGAAAFDRAEERRIEILKECGFNSIRTAHNPMSPYLLDVCDRLGMLVYDEFGDMWDVAKHADDYHVDFEEHWRDDLSAFIRRDRNHPSVFVWSVGNEIDSDPNGYGPLLVDAARTLDGSRPVALGGQMFDDSWSYVDAGDVHYAVDLTSFHDAHPDQPILRGEDATTHLHDAYEFDVANPWMVGTWVWTAWDYIGEGGIAAPAAAATVGEAAGFQLGALLGGVRYPWYQAFSGDIDLIGQRKPQSHWRSVVYGLSTIAMFVERPVPEGIHQYIDPSAGLFFSHYDELASWTWDVPIGTPMIVHVYAGGDSVSLFLDGNLLATRAGHEIQRRTATFEVPYVAGELTAVTSREGVELGRTTLVTTGPPVALRLASDVPSLTTSRDQLAHVLIEVVDADGLIGLGNGNPHNVDSFTGPRRHSWHGQALAVLRSAKHPGTLTITASADGLDAARTELPVRAASQA